jgi:hypothetical protein
MPAITGLPDLLFYRQEVLALDVGNLLGLSVHANQLGLKDVLLVGLLKAVRKRIDTLGFIELLLRIETIVNCLDQDCG